MSSFAYRRLYRRGRIGGLDLAHRARRSPLLASDLEYWAILGYFVATLGLERSYASSRWLTDINPGNSVTGILVFDVAVGTELVKLELHDSSFSGGVEVRLP